MRTLVKLGFLVLTVTTIACTENSRVRKFGGTATTHLPRCHKLVNVTWKGESDLWLLTRPARPGERAETHQFQENSSFGLIEGTFNIVEEIDPSCFK